MRTHIRNSSIKLNVLVALFLLAGSATFPSPVHADSVITVATNADTIAVDGLCSLREAIENANNDALTYNDCVPGSGNDTIQFNDGLGTSTIILGSSLPTITDLEGLTINGGGDITISGADLYTILFITTDVPLTLSNLTFADGDCPGTCGPGGIGSSGILTITNSIFTSINHTVISNGGTANITNSTFSANTTDFDASSIYNWGGATLNITNSTFSGNTTTYRGTIYNVGNATITKSTFSGNSSSNSGSVGAIYNQGTLTVTNSTFSANSGAGSNSAGAIYNNGAATITNSTFFANSISGPGGGAADVYHYGSTSTLNLYNNILANSTGGNCLNDFSAGPVTGNNNLIEDSSSACGFTHGSNGNIVGSDPILGTLTGSPAYFPLNTGSPAIDAGDDAICAAAPVSNTSQNGVSRTQGAHCDIGAFENLVIFTLTLKSVDTNDGWILESTETSGNGGTLNSTATNFSLGDDAVNKQYRAILHFDTSSLPDTAVITSATLKIKKQGIMGTDPFTLLGDLKASVRKPAFGAATLTLSDFKSAPGKNNVATFNTPPVSNWYSALVNNTGRVYINRTGTTQFRLAFTTDDNNDSGADLMKFYSGNAGAANRPQLMITYYVP
jgi:hypothetical protein